MEMGVFKPVSDDEESTSGNKLTLDNLVQDFLIIQDCFLTSVNMNLSMIWALKLEQTAGKGLVLHRNICTELERQKGQKAITAHFLNLRLSMPASFHFLHFVCFCHPRY